MASLTQTLGNSPYSPTSFKGYTYSNPGIIGQQSQQAFLPPIQQSPFFAALSQPTQFQAPASTYENFNFSFDPAEAKISALQGMNVEQAQNASAAARKQAIINSGIYDLPGEDPTALAAAQANPFSTLAKLKLEAQQRNRDLTNALASSNLLYSSEAARQYGDQARGEANAESDLLTALRGYLGDLTQGETTAEEAWRQAHPPVVPAVPGIAPPPETPPGQGFQGSTDLPHMGSTTLPPYQPVLPPNEALTMLLNPPEALPQFGASYRLPHARYGGPIGI